MTINISRSREISNFIECSVAHKPLVLPRPACNAIVRARPASYFFFGVIIAKDHDISMSPPFLSLLGLLTSLFSVSRLETEKEFPLVTVGLGVSSLAPLIGVNPFPEESVIALDGAAVYGAMLLSINDGACEFDGLPFGLPLGVGGNLEPPMPCARHQASSNTAGERLQP